MVNYSKDAKQEFLVNEWRKAKGIGTLLCPTGFGKTRIGIKVIDKILKRDPNTSITIVVSSEAGRKEWEANIDNYEYKINRDRIAILTTSYIIENAIEIKTILLIVDEPQKVTTELAIYYVFQCKYKYILTLTATYPTKGNCANVLSTIAPIVAIVEEQEAIDNDWLAPYNEYNYGITLSDEDSIKYHGYSTFMKDTLTKYNLPKNMLRRYKIDNPSQLVMAMYTGKHKIGFTGKAIRDEVAAYYGWHTGLDLTNEYNKRLEMEFNPIFIFDQCEAYMNVMRKRNKLMYNNHVRNKSILELVNKYKGRKTIIFNASTEVADEVTELLQTNGHKAIAYHSNLKSRPVFDRDLNDYVRYKAGKKQGLPKMFGAKSLKDMTIAGIKNNEYDIISTVAALNDSFNVESLAICIINGGSVDSIVDLQRKGRVKRIDYTNKDKLANIFNVYFKGTRDEYKLRERQKRALNEIKEIDSLHEINQWNICK